MASSDLEGRTALVTGGAKGIGRACCKLLAQAGVQVAINYRSSQKQAEETAQLVEAAGSVAHTIRADVSLPEQVKSMVVQVQEALGPIDLLVNNAAVFDMASHEETTLKVWRQTLDINLTGTYLVTWAVKDSMIKRRWGRIVNISSIAALRARPMAIAYSVSKAGIIALTKSLSTALAPYDIRINAVAPGLIDTDMAADMGQETMNRLISNTSISRLGTPGEIANVVLFLLGEQSSFITGQTIVSSGGRVHLP